MIGESKASTVWRQVATGDRWLRLFVAIRCQAVVRCELSLHRLATGGYGRQVATALCSHPLPSGGAVRGRPPPSGDRWLRRQVATDSS
jgi:hypothetical protein